jgi:lysophospholipase L1-like esterase
LLQADAFRSAVAREAALDRPYADTFAAGLESYRKRREKAEGTVSMTPGDRIESALRRQLNKLSWFAGRHRQKAQLMELLYRCRLYLLRIRGTTARSIIGPRLLRSQSAIEEIARLCQQHHIRLVLVFSPMNPAVNLFRTAEDRQNYRTFFEDLARRKGFRLIDLENSIGAAYWGMYFNTPDPLHLSREGHRQMARLLEPALAEELFGR